MKKFTIPLMVILFAISGLMNNVLAQAPEGIIYQAEARDSKGKTLNNKALDVKIRIVQDSRTGFVVYEELHKINTSNDGMFVLTIGQGTNALGLLENVDWGNHPHFLNVQVKEANKNVWTDMGTSQLLSVPYALHAKTAEAVTGTISETDPLFTSWDKSSGISIKESQIRDLEHFTNSDEIDPVYSAAPAASITDAGSGAVITDAERTKLFGIAVGAEVNVQSDWNEADNTEDSYIANKPTNLSTFTNDAGYLTEEIDGSVTNELIESLVLNGTVLEVTDAGGTKSADLSSLLTGETNCESCDMVLNILLHTTDVAKLISAGVPLLDLFKAGYGVGSLIQQGITEQDLVEAGLIGTFIDERDNHVYKWVKIGNQIWMAENLAYLPAVVGPGTRSTTTSYYYVYGYNGTNVSEAKATSDYTTYGVLYNWPAAMAGSASSTANPSGVLGVCPAGWHLPSDAEWTELTDYLGGLSVAGGKLKEIGTSHWYSPNNGATNETGFSALPGGVVSNPTPPDNLGFRQITSTGYWWSASEVSNNVAWSPRMSYYDAEVGRFQTAKHYGLSVRCVKE
jgi:uncharacterized protein (TIGR02145 family)